MEIYHLLNRGVDKRKVVLNDKDRLRFINDLFVFNDINFVDPNYGKSASKARFLGKYRQRTPLVMIHTFCLMPNHYHILASECVEGGIPKFMQKLNKGYTQYFNNKYSREGALWQGKYKKILVQDDAHFLYLPYYIHANPLDMSFPEWRASGVSNIKKALKYLISYRWSSHIDYAGGKNFPSVIDRSFLSDQGILGTPEAYLEALKDIISTDKESINIKEMTEVLLE